jgi:protein phosphatase
VEPDLTHTSLEPGDVVLLCTDGLWGSLEDAEIGRLLSAGVAPAEAVRRIVAAALAAGSTDNVTALVARVDPA